MTEEQIRAIVRDEIARMKAAEPPITLETRPVSGFDIAEISRQIQRHMNRYR